MKITRPIAKELKKKEFDYFIHSQIQNVDQEQELNKSKPDEIDFDWIQLAKGFSSGQIKMEQKHIAPFPVKKNLPNHLEKHLDSRCPHITPTLLDGIAAVCCLMLDNKNHWQSQIARKTNLSPYMVKKIWSVLIDLKIILFEANHNFYHDQQRPTLLYRLDEMAMRLFLQDKGYL